MLISHEKRKTVRKINNNLILFYKAENPSREDGKYIHKYDAQKQIHQQIMPNREYIDTQKRDSLSRVSIDYKKNKSNLSETG